MEIESHIKVGLIAPMILTSLFISRSTDSQIRKKVAFISSGAAFSPFPGDRIYCSAKAGVNMFAQCVGLEQRDKPYGFEVITISPGMVDTYLQQVARSKPSDEYPSADYLRQAYEQGQLENPEKVAEQIYRILENKYEQGRHVKVSEA